MRNNERYEIWEFDSEDIKQFNRDYGYGAFREAIDIDDGCLFAYGTQVGAEPSIREAKQFIFNYYGGWPSGARIVIWDDNSNEIVNK